MPRGVNSRARVRVMSRACSFGDAVGHSYVALEGYTRIEHKGQPSG